MFFPVQESLRSDLPLRHEKIKEQLAAKGCEALLLTSPSNLFYVAGRVYLGYAYFSVLAPPLFFPLGKQLFAEEEQVAPLRKPEEIPTILHERGLPLPATVALETGETSPAEYFRLQKLFDKAALTDATVMLRTARMIKTDYEIEELRRVGRQHAALYEEIPSLYEGGMTDLALAAAIENHMRLAGSIGYFRTFGFRMEGYMGVVLAGENGSVPSPYDFSLGGRGLSPAYPVGCCNRVIEAGETVLVDLNFNPRGYMVDLSRTFYVGALAGETRRIHDVARAIQAHTAANLRPGTLCSQLYSDAVDMAAEAGLAHLFMGEKKQAAFLGHGVGIDINELPVLMERSEQPLLEGMVIAAEPKFVTQCGAVGVEDTFLVTAAGAENLTACPDELRPL